MFRQPSAHLHTALPAFLNGSGYRRRHFWNHEEVARDDGETEEKADFDLPRNDHLSKVILDPVGPRCLASVVVFGGHRVKGSGHRSHNHRYGGLKRDRVLDVGKRSSAASLGAKRDREGNIKFQGGWAPLAIRNPDLDPA
tara:strand:+ start:323 stop:742 length:420 start_codon:yes stop_codon:yes gene_type:complete